MRNVAILAFASVVALSTATENRLVLVNQSDFGAKKGFYLSLENSAPGNAPCALASLRLIFAVGDGQSWKFLSRPVTWRVGQRVRVAGRWERGVAQLVIDDQVAVQEPAGLVLAKTPLVLNEHPSWASGEAEYLLTQGSAQITGLQKVTFAGVGKSLLSVFEAPSASARSYTADLSKPLVVEADFAIHPKTTGLVNGVIDPFGQVSVADFPGKVRNEKQLKMAHQREQAELKKWKSDANLDEFGGYRKAGWREKETGFYRVTKRGKVWWMISPKGNPLFYTGMCTSPALKWDMTPITGRESLFQALPSKTGLTVALWGKDKWGQPDGDYLCVHAWNLIRIFGRNWQASAAAECRQRLLAWGFTGQAKWSDPVGKLPYCPVLSIDAPKTSRHFDVFDPATQIAMRESLQKQIEPMRKDPWVVGWSIGNEFDECITNDEVKDLLAMPISRPIRKAMADYMTAQHIDKPEGPDLEKLRQFVAKAYYGFLYRTVKEIDPNHLYFGYWIVPGWWQNESDWDLIAPYCDVIGYDRYAPSYAGIENLFARHDKPTFLGEYSYPAWYDGTRGFGRYGTFVSTDADSGRSYSKLIQDASRDPKCVGVCWFQYRDQPITGRGPGHGPRYVIGEHYAFGFVDGTNRPKTDLVGPATVANRKATRDRLGLR